MKKPLKLSTSFGVGPAPDRPTAKDNRTLATVAVLEHRMSERQTAEYGLCKCCKPLFAVGAMAVREFTDAVGRKWRAWDINPDAIHPQTRAEDYLADCFQLGWIVFETVDGSDKRRLCPPPRDWDTLSEGQLHQLLAQAQRIPLSKLARQRSIAGETPTGIPKFDRRADDVAPAASSTVDVTDLSVVRSFLYPGGRVWSASLAPDPAGGGTRVLRFTSGMRHLDLARWPRDWPDYPDERLVELLRTAAPRNPGSSPPPGVAGRRHTDSRREG